VSSPVSGLAPLKDANTDGTAGGLGSATGQ
jgi:hypothetical protein